jgi:transcriptional regulator with XRE-family HTH domain
MKEKDLLLRIGQKVKKTRLKKQITQEQLAFECNFEKARISKIESGRINLTVRSLLSICNALDIKIDKLFS